MKKYYVYIEREELKPVCQEDVLYSQFDNSYLVNRFLESQVNSNGDTVEDKSEREFDTKEEAQAWYNKCKTQEYSKYYMSNRLVQFRRIVLEERDVDEDDYVLNYEYLDTDWLEINGYPSRNKIEIKTYQANWVISWCYSDGKRDDITIYTDYDNINSEIYDDLKELVCDIIDRIEERDCILSDDEIRELETKCEVFFGDRLNTEYDVSKSDKSTTRRSNGER